MSFRWTNREITPSALFRHTRCSPFTGDLQDQTVTYMIAFKFPWSNVFFKTREILTYMYFVLYLSTDVNAIIISAPGVDHTPDRDHHSQTSKQKSTNN